MKTNLTAPSAIILILLAFASPLSAAAQDSTSLMGKVLNFPDKLFASAGRRSEKMQQRLLSSSENHLKKLRRQEKRLQRKLAKTDSAQARELFGDVDARYDSLTAALYAPPAGRKPYNAHLDSVNTAVNFLKQQKDLSVAPGVQQKLGAVSQKLGATNQQFGSAQSVQQQIAARQNMLRDQLKSTPLAKELNRYTSKAYYYKAQLNEYKNILEEPGKLESTLMKAVTKVPAFTKFFNRHSELAGLFRLPGADDDAAVPIEGLQTRAMVNEQLEGRLGSGPEAQNYMRESIADAQGGLEKAKKQLNKFGDNGGDMDMPDFKPNNQKSKSFLERLELGTNLQSNRSNGFFPVTSDFGLSVGYRLTDKSVLGIGSSYRMGWGESFRKIAISHEGVGLRSFYEMKLKGSFWVSGGAEMNYRSRFNRIAELEGLNNWQQSALLGISKKYQVSKKVKGNVQLMYDFLHTRQVPRTQPVVFRVGYKI